MFDTPPLIDPFDTKSHISYAQAAKVWPGGGVSPHTIWRYTSKGRGGVKLPSIPVSGGSRVTTREAIRWFFAELQRPQQTRTVERRRLSHADYAAVDAECDAAGI